MTYVWHRMGGQCQGIQHVCDCTITIEMAICPMSDRGTQMGPMAAQIMGPCMGPMP